VALAPRRFDYPRIIRDFRQRGDAMTIDVGADPLGKHAVFVTGGTGYVGRALIRTLIDRGRTVRALVRAGSETRLPAGAFAIIGDALDASSFATSIAPATTLVHLVGTPHPSPSKAREFRDVDLASIRASVTASVTGGVRHIVYVSVAQPAPVMRDYIAARQEGEALVRNSKIPATILRPWYVLGPGHRWPCLLLPFYALLERLPATRDGARRLGLVTLEQMVAALTDAIARVPVATRIIEVPEIRTARALAHTSP
jgi:uncharacterized protein YbjT (DUF2867 family)